MIELAMRTLAVADPARVAVAGDTRADIEAGLRSGAAVVAGVLTGSDDEAALREAGATNVLESVVALPAVLGVGGR
jgi:phosphoglycolate phosphatase-like HAD superfamily hydrolase